MYAYRILSLAICFAGAIGLIVDGLDGSADILKWGFHYTIAGFEVHLGEILLSGLILVLFGILNILGVKKAGLVQTLLAVLLSVSVVILLIATLVSGKASGANMTPLWGFDKEAALGAGVSGEAVKAFGHYGTPQILSSVLATFAIAPWAFVGFDTIPQAAEELLGVFGKVLIGVAGVIFSLAFMVLQLFPIPGLFDVHIGKESYLMLIIWIVIGSVIPALGKLFYTWMIAEKEPDEEKQLALREKRTTAFVLGAFTLIVIFSVRLSFLYLLMQ